MHNKSIFLGLLLAMFFSKAQQVYPLNTFMENISQGGYVKDINNELSPFVGVYKANYQGNQVILYITKVINKPEKSINKDYYMDALVIKYVVKNSAGVILQDTQNNSSKIDFYSIGTMPQFNAVVLLYSGTNCGVGWGTIYFRKINSNQIYWDYRPNDTILDQQNCPGNQDIKIYLPVTKDLIFTKQ